MKVMLKNLVFRLRGTYTVEKLVKRGLTVGKNFNPQIGFDLDPSHCWLISIGDNVTFGPGVRVLAHDASMHGVLGYTKIGRVQIGNQVFVGADTIIMPNVTIGDQVIIGAGSVVTKNVPAGKVYAGNPAREICETQAFLEKHRNMMRLCPIYDETYTLRNNITEEKKLQQQEDLTKGVGYVV